jgi:hypothetical protein
MCIFFHKWSKWKQYKEVGRIILGYDYPENVQGKMVTHKEIRQQRSCLKCGLVEDERIK